MHLIRINDSQPQHLLAGRLSGQVYCGGVIESVLSRDQDSGYPHNGGQHSLSLTMRACDVDAFLALVEERFNGHEGVQNFVGTVRVSVPQRLAA